MCRGSAPRRWLSCRRSRQDGGVVSHFPPVRLSSLRRHSPSARRWRSSFLCRRWHAGGWRLVPCWLGPCSPVAVPLRLAYFCWWQWPPAAQHGPLHSGDCFPPTTLLGRSATSRSRWLSKDRCWNPPGNCRALPIRSAAAACLPRASASWPWPRSATANPGGRSVAGPW